MFAKRQSVEVLGCGLWLALGALLAAPNLQAEPPRSAVRDFSIPAGSLATALNTLAEQSNSQLIYDAPQVRTLSSPVLSGRYTLDEALQRLLAGSGLRHRVSDNGTITIEPDSASRGPRAQPQTEASAADNRRNDTDMLPEMTVMAKAWAATNYNVPIAATATKTDTSIMETPVSIQIVPRQVLKDQQVVRLDKALQNVSGVFAQPTGTTNGASGDLLNIRGFETQFQYRNGMRSPQSVNCCALSNDLANIEQVEVLKGPASILYGRIEPGGLVNLLSKQPLSQPYYAFQQQFGSFNFYRTSVDTSGPLGHGVDLAYRFNFAYEQGQSFIENLNNERVIVAPVLRWDPSPATQVTVELQYRHARDPFIFGAPVVGNRPAAIPRERNLSEPGAELRADDLLAGVNWTHAFNDRWRLRHRFYANVTDGDTTEAFPFAPPSSDGTIQRGTTNEFFHSNNYYTTLDLIGQLATGVVKHKLLLGGDYFNEKASNRVENFAEISSINVFNPVHATTLLAAPASGQQHVPQEWFGFYMQDQVQLPRNIHLLAGFRYDRASTLTENSGSLGDTVFNQEQEAVNPRFGVLWRPVPALSLYGSYVESFGAPQTALQADGTPLPPETARQWEVGAKTELLEGRFSGSLAWFDLTKQNITTPDPFRPAGFVRLTGEARNQGLELDASGEVFPGWKLIGTYTYIDSAITGDAEDEVGNPVGNQGHRLRNVPRHAGSFWSTYEPQTGVLRDLKLGAGVVVRGQREGDNENTYQLPGYATVNLMLSYALKLGPSKLNLQLNVDNLLDKNYYSGADGFAGQFGVPRSFLGSVRLEL